MHNTPLKIFATSYDSNGEMTNFAIGIGSKWIGWIRRSGRFFEATVGPAKGKGITPEAASRAAWCNFVDWDGPRYGMYKPTSLEMERDRISLRTMSPISMEILVGGKVSGEVTKMPDGKFRATIGSHEKVGVCAMSAARLAWLKKLDKSQDSNL